MRTGGKYAAASTLAIVAGLLVAGCQKQDGAPDGADAAVSGDTLAAKGSAGAEWLSYGGTYDEQRHSRLTKINAANVGDLGVAWVYELKTGRGVETTPLIVDGVMYATSAWSVVHALDARTGKELWVYDPGADKAVGVDACCDVVNRGVAYHDGKIYLGVIDGRLEAIDAKTGKVAWSVQTVDRSKPYTVTGAPRVVKGKVLIGNGGAELGVRGYLSAYDANTGALAWRFYTVPNPEMKPDGAASDAIFAKLGNGTWGKTGAWTRDGGGGTVWDSIVYDEVNDQIVFGVGNGSPWNARLRDPDSEGDNLFLSSIVAVDADTGTYKWHYQTTPRENWDYTATQTIILANLPLGEGGAPRRVVMQAPKNGFFYVLDAKSGQFLSGKAYVPMNWATGLDEKGRPIETKEARYENQAHLQSPGPLGGHNWHPMAFNPDLGLAYIPAQEIPQAYENDTRFTSTSVRWNTGIAFEAGLPLDPPPGTMKALRATLKGRLIAWDPVKQEPRWKVEHDGPWNGGILSTAGGLVFQGTLKGDFTAYDAANGSKLWSMNLKSGVAAPAVTYELDGEQYVTVATGWGSAFLLAAGYAVESPVPPALGKVITFKLGAKGSVPEPDAIPIEKKPQTAQFGNAKMWEAGLVAYSRNCMVCHGPFGVSSGVLPDLRWSPLTADQEAWDDVVINGSRASAGMVDFAKQLRPGESEAIRAYIVRMAHNPAS